MANTIVLKNKGTAGSSPSASDLILGEVALNYNDGKLITNIHDNYKVNTIRYSQNGTKILSGSDYGNIKIFNLNSTESVNHFKDSSTV